MFCKTAVTARHLLASAAVPPIFRAIQVDGHHYWDGLFTSNPPIREFTDTAFMPTKPDELWIVQINPQGRDQEPGTLSEMVDRRNELSGNLALAQELHFIEKINQLVADHPSLRKVYQHIECKVVALPPFPGLDYASKLDRRPGLIDDLMAWGREAAPAFLSGAGWTNGPSLTSRSRRVA